MKYIIDRFENSFAVCQNQETHEMLNLNKTLLPDNAKEGDLIEYEDGKIELLDNTELRAKIREKMNSLWN